MEFARCNATGVIPAMLNPWTLPVGYQLDPEHRVVPAGTEYVKMVGPQVWVLPHSSQLTSLVAIAVEP